MTTQNETTELEGPEGETKRAQIIGTGLIGGSVGLALRAKGWFVSGIDTDEAALQGALGLGAVDAAGVDPEADLTFVATPVGTIPDLALRALSRTSGVVTDVGSTKRQICELVDNARFVGGHPMAGSEQDGISGAKSHLFEGAMWVLTPTLETDEQAFATVRAAVKTMGAETIALEPKVHDEMVAQVSHVPHLTAATLMCLADDSSIEHRALLRLAAGGFRDMTRISAGRASIWPDICVANRDAIVAGLDQLVAALGQVREQVATNDSPQLLSLLERARDARINLPTGFGVADELVEITIPVPDRPGEIAAIANLAAELDVNIFDLELTHSGEGHKGMMILMVDAEMAERLLGGLIARKYRPRSRKLD